MFFFGNFRFFQWGNRFSLVFFPKMWIENFVFQLFLKIIFDQKRHIFSIGFLKVHLEIWENRLETVSEDFRQYKLWIYVESLKSKPNHCSKSLQMRTKPLFSTGTYQRNKLLYNDFFLWCKHNPSKRGINDFEITEITEITADFKLSYLQALKELDNKMQIWAFQRSSICAYNFYQKIFPELGDNSIEVGSYFRIIKAIAPSVYGWFAGFCEKLFRAIGFDSFC